MQTKILPPLLSKLWYSLKYWILHTCKCVHWSAIFLPHNSTHNRIWFNISHGNHIKPPFSFNLHISVSLTGWKIFHPNQMHRLYNICSSESCIQFYLSARPWKGMSKLSFDGKPSPSRPKLPSDIKEAHGRPIDLGGSGGWTDVEKKSRWGCFNLRVLQGRWFNAPHVPPFVWVFVLLLPALSRKRKAKNVQHHKNGQPILPIC